MLDSDNPNSIVCVFITGKRGTGKRTFDPAAVRKQRAKTEMQRKSNTSGGQEASGESRIWYLVMHTCLPHCIAQLLQVYAHVCMCMS